MGKVMIEAQPGALVDVLKKQSKTQEEVAGAIGCSRKTIQIINKGDPVKDTTLKRIADYLRVPVDHLILKKDNQALVSQADESEKLDNDDGILLRYVDGDRMDGLLIFSNRVIWRLDIRPNVLSVPTLRALESAVRELHELHSILSADFGSLSNQLKSVEAIETIDQLLKSISEHKLHVLGNSFLEWSCKHEDGYFTHGDTYMPGRTFYTSDAVVILCIESTSVKSKRVKIWTGSKPPKFSPPEAPEVWVNDKLLPVAEVTGKETEDDQELPF